MDSDEYSDAKDTKELEDSEDSFEEVDEENEELSSFHDAKLLEFDRKIIEELEELRTSVGLSHYKCNLGKSVGVGIGGVGTAGSLIGLMGAPASGGISLFLTFGGVASAVGGTLTSITTSIIRKKSMNGFWAQLDEIICKRNEFIANHCKSSEVEIVGDEHGIFVTLRRAFRVGNALRQVQANALKAAKATRVITKIVAEAQATPAGRVAMAKMIKYELKALNELPKLIGFPLGAKALKMSFVGLGLIGTAYEFIDTWRSWTNPPDILNVIGQFVHELESQVESMDVENDYVLVI